MSKTLEKNYHYLLILSKSKSALLLKSILKENNESLLRALTEIAFNLLKEEGLITPTSSQRRFLTKNKKLIEKLADKGVGKGEKKKILLKNGPKFCNQLITPVLQILDSLHKK